MLSVGTQRTLARVSSASATQTPAWAAATTRGRASESRSAVARLIGNRKSFWRSGAGLSRMSVASAPVPLDRRGPTWAGRLGSAGGRSGAPRTGAGAGSAAGALAGAGPAGAGVDGAPGGVAGAWARPIAGATPERRTAAMGIHTRFLRSIVFTSPRRSLRDARGVDRSGFIGPVALSSRYGDLDDRGSSEKWVSNYKPDTSFGYSGAAWRGGARQS